MGRFILPRIGTAPDGPPLLIAGKNADPAGYPGGRLSLEIFSTPLSGKVFVMADDEAKTLDEETKALLNEVALVAGKLGGGEVRERPRHHLEIVALYDRCRSTFGAVRLLAQAGFGQEAVALGRSVFTESLMLMELAEADELRRIELVVGWSLASVDDLTGVLREAEARGDDVTEELEAMKTLRASLEGYARRNNARTRRWRPDEKALALKHDVGGYLDFRMAHHFVHGSTFASEQRLTMRDDVAFIGGPAARGGWSLPAALFAAQSLVFAIRAVSTIVDVPEPEKLDELLERIEEDGRRGGLLT